MSFARSIKPSAQTALASTILFLGLWSVCSLQAVADPKDKAPDLVGTQYDTTHVYVTPDKIDALVACFVATFGGQPTKRIVTNVLPVPSSTESQAIFSPSGNLPSSHF